MISGSSPPETGGNPPEIAVVGGGIAGLAAARALARGGARVVVHEASERYGGKIETVSLDGHAVDTGADAFIARAPEAVQLCRELGLGEELVSPAAASAGVWVGGKVRPLPDGLVLGVPVSLGPLARSGIVSRRGLLRAALEPLLPRTRWDGDIAVGELVRRRFGQEVQDALVDPLLGGINAGRSERLSIEVGAPQLAEAARAGRSLTLSLMRRAPVEGPVFYGLRGGMSRLVDALVADLRQRGVELHTGSPVESLDALGDAVVVAAPAPVARRLIPTIPPVDYSDVALTTFVYPASAFPAPPEGSGFLVPRVEGRLMTACSFGSNKWPHWAEPRSVVLRVSAGRWGDDRAMAMDDEALAAALQAELREALGLQGEPELVRVRRWPDAFPQFEPGHLARVAALQNSLSPTVAVAGAWVRGVGIPACIASGHAAATRILGG